jgi:hypothetical protein
VHAEAISSTPKFGVVVGRRKDGPIAGPERHSAGQSEATGVNPPTLGGVKEGASGDQQLMRLLASESSG